ncbi:MULTISPECIES: hypothetical protein [Terrabacteria group]|uniref:hypothetical protein n=1 Tax=Bacillati TaxID=1783272 RepID=UPI001939D022|nr:MULTISPECIES: hypothetical protein [Terrabacteria group]MBW9213106.1 hypothetical protein [Trueperella sp. zg.1013]QRG86929.1 hypothetical protein JOS54_01020 [Bulleidia sp. zg-1006]
METNKYKSLFLPSSLLVAETEKAKLWKLPDMEGETEKFFWVNGKFVHKIGKDYVVSYSDEYPYTVFEQEKDENGKFLQVNPQAITGDEMVGIFIKYHTVIQKNYLTWKEKNNK